VTTTGRTVAGERARLRVGAAVGVRYGPLPVELEARLGDWFAAGYVEGVEPFEASRAFHWGDWVIKFSGPQRGWRKWLRPSPLWRAAELAFSLPALRTPRPLAVLERRLGGFTEQSLSVVEFVEGRLLHELWEDDRRAVEAFPVFLAGMHAAGIYHGDMHTRNAIWNGEEWMLLDLEGLRLGLHRLFGPRLVEKQWARIYHSLIYVYPDGEPQIRALYDDYRRARGSAPDWERVRAGALRYREAAGLADPHTWRRGRSSEDVRNGVW